jgi:hypothetical protein
MNTNQKSTLARLLATENLRVEHQQVQTAAFDLKNRTLILPIWKDMSNDLYDLLIGHEVGHALYTPAKGWHGEIDARGMGIKSYLNILEDARIERMIKDKFPGIRKNFFTGYQELFDKNFFGVKGRDLSTLRFIDRINLHYKVGPFLNVQFSNDEQPYIARIDAMKTWDDVAALAAELYELAKSEPEPEFDLDDLMDALSGVIEDGDDDGDGQGEPTNVKVSAPSSSDAQQSDDKSDETADAADDKGEGKSPASAGEKKSDDAADSERAGDDSQGEKQKGSSTTAAEPTYSDDPAGITDQFFRQMEDTFIDSESRPYEYGVLREVDPRNYVVPMNWLLDNMAPTVHKDQWTHEQLDSVAVANDLFVQFRDKNQKYINLMVQEFEMKRKASQFARASISKTGRLDVDRVWAHKISEDLFARNTVVPDGKNHGMLLFLDMSGSMSGNMKGSIEQLVTLMMFCRKVRIPFEVYGFTNNNMVSDAYPNARKMIDNRQSSNDDRSIDIARHGFFLLQFMSSNCSAGMFNQMIRNLLMCAEAFETRRRYQTRNTYRLPDFMGLASTPLEESIVLARSIAEQFRNKHRVEVLSTVFVTDGDGDDNVTVGGKYSRWSARNLTISDAKTGANVTVKYHDDQRNQMQEALLELYRKATGSRTMNFFIVDYNAKYFAQRLYKSADFSTKWKEEWSKGKYFHVTKSGGYDDRFLVPGGKELGIDADVLDTDATDAKELTKAFKKFQNKKQTNRVLLGKMIRAVA